MPSIGMPKTWDAVVASTLWGETGLLAQWPETGPPEAWRIQIGEGYSGIAIVGERLYVLFLARVQMGGQP